MTDAKVAKSCKKFLCKECDYSTSKLSSWKKHIKTQKHNRLTNTSMDTIKNYICCCGKVYKQRQSLYNHKKKCKIHKNETLNIMDTKWIQMDTNGYMSKNENLFECECGKKYKYSQGLSKHKAKCNYKNTIILKSGGDPDWKEMFMKLMEQNTEVLEKCTEIASKPTTINNTQFNVMNYLNNDCKDAMNLTDFINDFQFSLKDLDLLQSKGYQEAMERTFVKQLCDMDKTKRPIHCSDKKRKTFYVKDNDIWEKDEDNKKLITSVQTLSNIHNKALSKWRSYNSDWSSNDKKQDFFNKSVQEFTKCDHEKEQNKLFNKLTYLSIK